MSSAAKKILKKYIELAYKLEKWPSYADLLKYGLTKHIIRYYFGNLTNLRATAEKHDKALKRFNIFTDELLLEQQKIIAQYKKFVITTAVAGAPVHKIFLASLKQYCKINNAKLLIIPANYQLYEIDPILSKDPDILIVFRPLNLNKNVTVHPIKIDPKQVDPATGLEAIVKQNKTVIVGSPKQRRKHIANAADLSAVIQSTGAITRPNYTPKDGVPKRTDTLAYVHHVMGAIVVEIQNEKYFHFRNIEMSPDGSFIDLCLRYTPNGVKYENALAAVLGDYHVTETDEVVERTTHKLLKWAKPQYIIFHDFFSGVSINHHEADDFILMAQKALENKISLSEELKQNVMVIKDYIKRYKSFGTKLVFVRSNHDEFLKRYLSKGHYEPHNRALALELGYVSIRGEDPLIYGYKKFGLSEHDLKHIIFLKRDEPFILAQNYLSAHGDIGTNGSKNPGAKGMFKAYGKCIFGHTHTPEIWHGAISVGTSTRLKLGYNIGASSWLHAHALLYSDGTRQLINIIDGNFTTMPLKMPQNYCPENNVVNTQNTLNEINMGGQSV